MYTPLLVINATMYKESSKSGLIEREAEEDYPTAKCVRVLYSGFRNDLVSSVGDSESTLSLFLSL